MIQVATPGVVVVETCTGWQFSGELLSILGDPTIVKAFCGAGGDLDALPCTVTNVVDVQAQCAEALNCKKNDMPGLGKVLSWADPNQREFVWRCWAILRYLQVNGKSKTLGKEVGGG